MEEAAARRLRVTLPYFDGCPNWRTTYEQSSARYSARKGWTTSNPSSNAWRRPRTRSGFASSGRRRHNYISDQPLSRLLLDGRDPFDGTDSGPFGLTCRVYSTPEGLVGSPTPEQLRVVLRDAQATS